MNSLKFEWLSFLSALGLMSRIPIGFFIGQNQLLPEHHNRSQVWYPWVGAVLGGLLFFWLCIAPKDWSTFLSATLLVTIWVGFSGALHLDGFADSVDAWVGGMGDSRRSLNIMKDPTSGPMAVAALVLLLLLKVALVAELLESLMGGALVVLALVPVLARSWLLPFLHKTCYVRQKSFDAQTVQTSELLEQRGGMATAIASEFPFKAALISFVIIQVAALFLMFSLAGLVSGLLAWLLLNLGALIVFTLIRTTCVNRIGGYTGDVLGAFIELQEVVLLLALTFSVTLLS